MYLNTSEVKHFAEQLHKKQLMKSGKKYFGHCVRVAELAEEFFWKSLADKSKIDPGDIMDLEFVKQIAYLHDALEDRCSVYTLYALNVDPLVISAVEVLSKQAGQDYFTYLEGVKNHPLAKIVKLADLSHNSQLSRLPVEEFVKTKNRQEKYLKAFLLLSDRLPPEHADVI